MFLMRSATRLPALLLLLIFPFSLHAQTKYDEAARAYIAHYKDLAISEQKRTGIPAAIKLAQGIYETAAGTSELATGANNHFGMKCKKGWTGETFAHTDDAPNECFRKYPNAEASFRDQGNYLRSNPRYAACFATDVEDYRRWAAELRRAGYATNPKYADKITKTVEDYGLQQFTLMAEGKAAPQNLPVPTSAPAIAAQPPVRRDVAPSPGEVNMAVVPQPAGDGRLETYKGLQGFYARKGQSLLEAATRYNVRYAKLLEWNELADAPVPYDMFVFLEKKAARGGSVTHVVKPGETMHKIAQAEAMQVGSLRQLNMIDFTEEPQPGVTLQLQRAVTNRPAVYLPSQVKAPEVVVEVVQQRPVIKTEVQPEMPVVVTPQETMQPAQAPPANTMAQVVEPETSAVTEPVIPSVPVRKSKNPKSRIQVPEAAVKIPASRTEKGTLIAKADIADAPQATAKKEEDNEPVSTAMPDPTPLSPVSALVVNTSTPDAPAVPSEKAVETPDKPLPEYDDTPMGRLKAKMDRAVYAKREKQEPAPESTVPAPVEVPTPAAGNRPAVHTVLKGETVFSIAKKYGVSVTQLRKWNGMDFSAMKVGQKLKLKP